MRIVFFLVLLIGIGLAGSAVYLAQGYIAETQRELAAARAAAGRVIETTPVYTARKELRYGHRLTREDVAPIQWPSNAIPEGVFTDIDELFPAGEGPRAVMRAMERGEPILAVKVTRPGQDAGIAARLSPGMRAFTINVDVSTGVAGFLRPGDRVDVYWTGQLGRGNEVTRLLKQAVPVVAVDQSADMDRTEAARIARSVTVEASAHDVADLALAQSTGRLSLALVGLTSQELVDVAEVNRRSLFGIEDEPEPEAAPAAPEPEPECTVRTRRGGEMVTTTIPCTN